MKLTDTALKNAKPKSKPYKLYDGDGLFLLVKPNGSKLWRFKFTFEGKENSLSFGPYPAISLKRAREKMMQIWADYLDELKTEGVKLQADVIQIGERVACAK